MPPQPVSTAWPPLPYQDWQPTKQTLHRYVQMVGKVRMALMPFRNHWWHVTLYVSTRGVDHRADAARRRQNGGGGVRPDRP